MPCRASSSRRQNGSWCLHLRGRPPPTITAWPWRRGHYSPSKRREPFTRWRGIASHETSNFACANLLSRSFLTPLILRAWLAVVPACKCADVCGVTDCRGLPNSIGFRKTGECFVAVGTCVDVYWTVTRRKLSQINPLHRARKEVACTCRRGRWRGYWWT